MYALVCVCFLSIVTGAVANDRPVVGILALPQDDDYKPYFPGKNWYIPASYVKWLEAAGARVAFILPEWNDTQILDVLGQLNGVLFTGGAADINTGRFADVQRLVANASLRLNAATPFALPLWATCLGFEAIVSHSASGGAAVVTRVSGADDVSLPLYLSSECAAGGCFLLSNNTPSDVLGPLTSRAAPVAYNHHSYGVLASTFAADAGLSALWRVVSVSVAAGGAAPFVSTIEARGVDAGLAWFGTQWHPEKAQFEWSPRMNGLVHSAESVRANAYAATRFIEMTRRSTQAFRSDDFDVSFYSQHPTYTGNVSKFEECYFW